MPELLEHVESGVAVLTLNRPERLNALSPSILAGLFEALTRLGADAEVGVIVLTGSGRGFCSGGDVKGMAGRENADLEERVAYLRDAHRIATLLHENPKITIAMINGAAYGAGLSLALACDLRFAARSATMGTAFSAVGLSGDQGGSWTLTQLVGTAKARELYLLGDKLGAEEAAALGVVSRTVDDAELQAQTMAVARRIAAGPRVAQSFIKRNMNAAMTESFASVLELEAVHQARAERTQDHIEARRAFVEKRAPRFIGK